jgi:hypothetical protein
VRICSGDREPLVAVLLHCPLHLVGSALDAVLDRTRRLVDLAFTLEIAVSGEIPGGLLEPALGVVLVANLVAHCIPPWLSVDAVQLPGTGDL